MRLPILACAASLACMAAPAAGDATGALTPRARFDRALAALARPEGFRFAETVDVQQKPARSIRTVIRYQPPDRLETVVTTLLPPPIQQLTIVQVGRRRCQTPPSSERRTINSFW